ncbi:uncharacterized protein LOC109599449 isoform X2 [Aethina tumida]|uniref:uncharacterized protein LOC109599449 isoform X2 n=1 Tax=Aethina tumida TaxID=116153 RepID=UPI002147EBE5|nr:uncharacterized protein LOC109599449 isoform X2 [Aethina tumida]
MDEEEEINYNSCLGQIIKSYEKLNKNPTIEAGLSELLDVLIAKLNDTEEYTRNGIFSVNFVEASLVIQSAAQLYGKKVDLLWDHVLEFHERMISYDKTENVEEINNLEERINRYRRKKRRLKLPKATAPVSFLVKKDISNPDALCDGNLHLDWSVPMHVEERTYESRLFYRNKLNDSLINNFVIYDKEADRLYEEPNIKMDRWPCCKDFNFLYDICDRNYINEPTDIHLITKVRTELDLIFRYRLDKDIDCNVPRSTYEKDLKNWVHDYITARRDNLSLEIVQRRKKLCPAETVINIQRLPDALVIEKLRRISYPGGCIEAEKRLNYLDHPPDITNVDSSSSEDCFITIHPLNYEADMSCDKNQGGDKLKLNVLNLPTECLDDSAFHESDMSVECENTELSSVHDEVPEQESCLTKSLQEITNPSTPLLLDVRRSSRENRGKKYAKFMSEMNPETCKIVQKPDTSKLQPAQNLNKKRQIQDVQDKNAKRRKSSKKQLEKLAQPILSTKMSKFEKFYYLNYNLGEDEGEFPELVEDEIDDTYDCLGSPDLFDDVTSCPVDVHLDINSSQHINDINDELYSPDLNSETRNTMKASQDSGIGVSVDNDFDLDLDDTMRASDSYGDGCAETHLSNEARLKALKKESRINIKNWKSMITPKLQALENAEFDIHAYGSDIIDNMEVNEVKKFKDVVRGKSSKEVVRYFISSLQLANTYNIEIGGAQQGRISNDTFSMKLLTKERHHEHLNEYEAPSEEAFRENFKKIQEMKGKTHLHSTPSKIHPKNRSSEGY